MYPSLPIEYAASRDWSLDGAWSLDAFPTMRAAWARTRDTLARLSERLRVVALPRSILAIAVSGSMGRMEQLPHSDCDLVILLEDGIDPDSAAASAAMGVVWETIAPLELGHPRTNGIYSRPTTLERLCDPARRGQIGEDPQTFGKRIQLLLDSQPLLGGKAFRDGIDRVLTWYTGGNLRPPYQPHDYLRSDLLRYYHSLQVMDQWRPAESTALWQRRQLKLRHSRFIVCAGLLFLLANWANHSDRGADWLASSTVLTPLERIGWYMAQNDDDSFGAVLDAYETFLAHGQASACSEDPIVGQRRFDKLIANGSRLQFRLMNSLRKSIRVEDAIHIMQ